MLFLMDTQSKKQQKKPISTITLHMSYSKYTKNKTELARSKIDKKKIKVLLYNHNN